ncbi:MAG: NADH-quinone oxidoreductase subunit J [Syntrophomonadaceae bacterium]|jgi:NADH-quinone oxidoreductase subunit J|nr:NADH-quinone oxidoreductase subunit J [Syntrophomonadaceae bacterium]
MMREILASVSIFDIVFVAIAGFTLLCALAMILFNNIVHSMVAMIFCFLGIAGVYFTMDAGFIGMVQIMVYAGAISVILIFAFMVLMSRDPARSNRYSPRKGSILAGFFASGIIAAMLGYAIIATEFPVSGLPDAEVNQMEVIADLMLGSYVIPFEAAAILLLVAVIGAILLAKGVEKDR